MFIRDGGEYGFEANSEEEERERKRRTAELYQDRTPKDRRSRDGRVPYEERQIGGNRRDQNSIDRRPGIGQSGNRDAKKNDWTSFSSNADENTNKEDDFFDSLMSQLSNDLRDDASQNDSRGRGSRRHDDAGPKTRKVVVDSNTGAEDSFFDNLMAELGALDKSESFSRSTKSESLEDDDDFFSSLEAELSESLGGGFQNKNESGRDESDDEDFFANLESEISKVVDGSSSSGVDDKLRNDSFTTREVNDADDFFSSLIEDLAQEMEETEPVLMKSKKDASDTRRSSNLSSLTVPELKGLLRDKGLKVGGTKAELIDRLQNTT